MALVSVRELLSNKGLPMPTLDLFGTSSVSVIHWQPTGIFGSEYTTEIKNTNADHTQKCMSVVEIALERECSLLLTAEYSFPYSTLIEIVNNSNRWPKRGALWCLSMEGIQRINFDNLMLEYQKNEAVVPILSSRENIDSERKFISTLIYMFVIVGDHENNRLCIIPQLKIQPSSDRYMEHEKTQMTPGKTIFFFDDTGNNAIFASLICADAFNHDNVMLFHQYSNKTLFLFNPQLNYSFLHQAEVEFIENILNYRNERSFIISLNWAKGTEIQHSGIGIQHGFSSVIRKPSLEYDTVAISQNYQKGTCFGKNKYRDIWYFTCEEHVIMYSISSLISAPTHGATTKYFEPIITDYLSFDGIYLIPSSAECIIDWEWFNRHFTGAKNIASYTYYNTCGICAEPGVVCIKEGYTKCSYRHIAMFCHSFFEQSIYNENPFFVDEIGIGGLYSMLPNSLTNDCNNIVRKRSHLEGIKRTITQRERLPNRYKIYAGAQAWIVGNRTKNARYISEDGTHKDVWIVFVELESRLQSVRTAINERFKSDDEAPLRNRVLLCYIDPEQGYQYRDDGSTDIRDAKIWPNTKICL
ncbi:MAG: hypothetical protein LBC73_01810 [Oscillospiraceae bacterium]|jgi:hypothetical protein|nr:hypothetical protein [Oscillospiraceae bacterium]